MTETTNNIDIDAVEARRDELTREYTDIWHRHNDAINAIPARADLRTMDDSATTRPARRRRTG
jgi:hypothetical protein